MSKVIKSTFDEQSHGILEFIATGKGGNRRVENLRSGERGADNFLKNSHARRRVLVGGYLFGDHIG